MEFGWINVFGAVIVILMMIPNIIYAIRNKDEKNKCTNWFMNVIEQVGRYACIILMWMSLLVWKFGFSSVCEMILYLNIFRSFHICVCVPLSSASLYIP